MSIRALAVPVSVVAFLLVASRQLENRWLTQPVVFHGDARIWPDAAMIRIGDTPGSLPHESHHLQTQLLGHYIFDNPHAATIGLCLDADSTRLHDYLVRRTLRARDSVAVILTTPAEWIPGLWRIDSLLIPFRGRPESLASYEVAARVAGALLARTENPWTCVDAARRMAKGMPALFAVASALEEHSRDSVPREP